MIDSDELEHEGVCISDGQIEHFEGSLTVVLDCSLCTCGYNGVLGSHTT